MSHFYMNNLKQFCYECPGECTECENRKMGDDTYKCTSCQDVKMTIPNNICVCPDLYFLSTSHHLCIKCDDSCTACENDGNEHSRCTACPNRDMIVKEDGKCYCPDGKFLSNDKSKCNSCTAPCNLCTNDGTDKQKCTSCYDDKMDKDKNCDCFDTYFMTNNKEDCIKCPVYCPTCVADEVDYPKCSKCVDPINMQIDIHN